MHRMGSVESMDCMRRGKRIVWETSTECGVTHEQCVSGASKQIVRKERSNRPSRDTLQTYHQRRRSKQIFRIDRSPQQIIPNNSSEQIMHTKQPKGITQTHRPNGSRK